MHRKSLPGICAFAIIISVIMLAVPVHAGFRWPSLDTEHAESDEQAVPTEAMLSEEDPYEDDKERVLDVVLAFGLMGNVSPDATGQTSAPYERLLRVLLAYPELKFSVGASGTLLTGLAWQGSSALQLLRDGVARGVIEPLGTTFSEGVLASMEPWDAQLATSLGAEAVAEFTGEKPSGFWNSSGVWKQEIVVPIAVGGYTHTVVEDTIVRGSGLDMLPPNAPVRVAWGGREVVLFQADTDFGRLVDNAIRTGSPRPVMDYLRRIYDGDKQDSAVVVYARELMAAEDDMEWERLASLLQALADEEWINVTTLGERVKSGPPPGSVIQIAEGAPRGVQASSSKEGFPDWRTFNSDSEDLQALRTLYSEVRGRIHSVEAAVRKAEASGKDISAAQKLLDHSKKVFISAQYGLGRPGSGGAVSGGANWEMGRAAYVSALAAWQCVNPTVSVYQEDANRDGVDEVIMTTNTDMFVLSPIGAKLLYWHDLENGEVLVGSEIQQYSGESFVNESMAGGGLDRVLLDTMSGPAATGMDLPLAEYEAQLGEGFPNACFTFRHGSTTIEKSVAAKDRALAVDYTIKSRGRIDLTVSNNFSPDMRWIQTGGRDAIVYYDPNGAAASSLRQGSNFGLMNVISGTLIRVIPHQNGDENVPLSRVSSVLGSFGRHLDLEYRFTIAPGASAGLGFELQRGKTWPSPSAVSWIEGSGKTILAGLPTYTRACTVRQFIGGYISDMPMTSMSRAARKEGAAQGKTISEVEAPMPQGRYDLVATLVTGRKALIENAGSYVKGTSRHEFFPEVRDSTVEITSGYARVGGTLAAWVAVGVGAAVVLAAVIIYIRRREAPGA